MRWLKGELNDSIETYLVAFKEGRDPGYPRLGQCVHAAAIEV